MTNPAPVLMARRPDPTPAGSHRRGCKLLGAVRDAAAVLLLGNLAL